MRIATEQAPRNLALTNNLNEQEAERKVISFLFISLGTAGRKSVTDKFPDVATVTLQKLRTNCDEAFSKPRNRTLDTFKFYWKKQKDKETLRQIWHTLTGLAAKCEFGEQTESLVMDTFIQNMNNKTVQERLCTEPKNDPQEVFRFAVAYQEGVNQHKTYEGRNIYKKPKQELVFAVNQKKIRAQDVAWSLTTEI